MIIKQLFQGKDYQQTLRRRLGIFIGLTVLGLLLIALSFTAMLTTVRWNVPRRPLITRVPTM